MSKLDLAKVASLGKKIWEEHGDQIIEGAGKLLNAMQKNVATEQAMMKLAAETDTPKIAEIDGAEVEVLDSSAPSQKMANADKQNVKVTAKGGKLIVVDVVDHDDTYFEDMLATLQEASKQYHTPQEAQEALKVLAQCAQETIKYCEEQETKRVDILAKRDEAIAQINSVTQMVKDYLDRTFDERSKMFAQQFECLDAALKSGNSELLATTVGGINSLAAESPFKSLADVKQVQQSLTEGTEWDI